MACCSPNVPYEKQQFEALNAENGILDISYEQMTQLTDKLRNTIKNEIIELEKSE